MKRKRVATVALLAASVCGVIYGTRSSVVFFRNERAYLERDADNRRRQAALDSVFEAALELEQHGAWIGYGKMQPVGSAPFQDIDLENWSGGYADLKPLLVFKRLTETGKPSSLNLRLGPKIGNEYVGIFLGLTNLRNLDLNDAPIDDDRVRSLRTAIPECVIVDSAKHSSSG